jgi:glycosyltransferase involved in cell wall biosynthesis
MRCPDGNLSGKLRFTPTTSSTVVYSDVPSTPVAFDLRDPDRSGLARVARSLMRAFVARFADEFDITLTGPVAALESLGARTWAGEQTDPRRVRLVSWNAGRYAVAAQWQWRRVRREVGPAIWLFPHWDVPLIGRPERYVVMIHDVGHLRIDGVSRIRRGIARRWMRSAAAAATRIIAVTEFTRRELTAEWPDLAHKVTVVPNGVAAEFLQPAPALNESFTTRLGGVPFLLSVGIRKRHKNLLMGAEVLARVPNVQWVVVGEKYPEWNEVIQRARDLGVADRIIESDRESDDVLRSLYAEASALLFPSRYEGFGLPIIEALAAGTPVIVSNSGASPETAGGLGWVCHPDDAEAFASAVRDAITLGPRRDAIASVSRDYARTFTWERGASALAAIIREVV